MIDGIKIYYQIRDFEAWRKAVRIDLFTATDLETGATKGKTRLINGGVQQTITYRGNFETYQITIKETTRSDISAKRSVSYFLAIDGSLHKNYFNGANYLPFTWDCLQTELCKLETSLQLASLADIVNLEIGVNIPLPFPVLPFLKQNLISYKGNQFNRYDPDENRISLGYVCPLSQYSVKIYDKGTQFNLPAHLMRFELRYLKMQTLKERGIKHLTDLTDFGKVNGLLALLLSAWDNVLLYDSAVNLDELKPKDRDLLKEGRRPGYWEQLQETSKPKFNYQRQKFRELVAKFGSGWHEKIRESINIQWKNLFENCTILPSGQTSDLDKFTVKVKGKNGQTGHYKKEERVYHGQGETFSYPIKKEFLDAVKKEFFDTEKKGFLNTIKKRSCQSCGRDISDQDPRSKFCSAKYVGVQAAHRCRNTDSNPRNNLKNKLTRINSRGVLFDIAPFFLTK